MAFDELLATRIRASLGIIPGLVEKKMFGGIGFLLHGNMACGVHRNDLIVRVGSDNYQQALALPNTHPFDMTGTPMSGWIMVQPKGCKTDDQLSTWIGLGIDFARSLPIKSKR
jgi:TfoX/Sxy family transcriptional regulator of competence genes